MADGRFLSRRGSESHQLAEVSLPAAYLFTWCIPHLDVEGRMPGDPALVKARAVPLRRDIPDTAVPVLLRELVAAGLVSWYAVGGRQYLAFPGFHASQKGLRKDKEAASRIPAPDSKGATAVPTDSVPTPSLVPTGGGLGTPEEKGSEVEVQGKARTVASQPAGAEFKTAPNGKPENPMAVLGPLIRKHLYIHDGKPPEGYDDRRCADICMKLVRSGRYSVDDVRDAILVVPRLRTGTIRADESLQRWFAKQPKLTMLALNDRWGSGSVLDQLLHIARKDERGTAQAVRELMGVA